MRESNYEKSGKGGYSHIVLEELLRLIEKDEYTKSLTVAQMALRDLESGDIKSAVSRLRVDLDKYIVTNRELYNYLIALKETSLEKT